ncbi:neuralized-like protein 2 [Scaptodrosophila lebanonensis]|uniref:Neuralized-like protein 2 n=1 Tax=Drosophila lebanonensis TaxID=7225 RepID=A0A6J2TD44_DROLE|nr:neuralized-like protein 2 [Scaptodrosophila lebanonensis]
MDAVDRYDMDIEAEEDIEEDADTKPASGGGDMKRRHRLNSIWRFHPFHGANVVLLENSSVALRHKSFADALLFSEQPLTPGDIFLVEIEQIESEWSGHMRMGLTLLVPDTMSGNEDLPRFSLPEMSNYGNTWIFPLSKYAQDHPSIYQALPYRNLLGESTHVRTPRGLLPKKLLYPTVNNEGSNMPLGAIGCRIGMIYAPTENNPLNAELHFIINGVDKGPAAKNIPLQAAPLYIVIDLYGATKKIRIIQLDGLQSLQGICRNVIHENFTADEVMDWSIPITIKRYLLPNC